MLEQEVNNPCVVCRMRLKIPLSIRSGRYRAGCGPVRDGRGEPSCSCICTNPEGERTTRNQRLVVLRLVGDRLKHLAHECCFEGDGGDRACK